MQKRGFGRTGLQVPVLTYGGGWVGGFIIRAEIEAREKVLNRALEAGIDWIDTAAAYGNGASETVLGEWLPKVPKDKRPRISTKFNIDVSVPGFRRTGRTLGSGQLRSAPSRPRSVADPAQSHRR